jgi:hypothetical protein
VSVSKLLGLDTFRDTNPLEFGKKTRKIWNPEIAKNAGKAAFSEAGHPLRSPLLYPIELRMRSDVQYRAADARGQETLAFLAHGTWSEHRNPDGDADCRREFRKVNFSPHELIRVD